ncbi:MAG: sugar transferase [Planctomycetes bacterium]|nr:sugar transferase [Planctomycetota bacterium]
MIDVVTQTKSQLIRSRTHRLRRRAQLGPFRPVGYDTTKRIFDIAVCLLLVPVILPLILVCGVIHWLESPGPILFLQWRTGLRGKRFRMFKLRTMLPNAAELKEKYAHLNELAWPDFKISSDPRITRVGRFLRKSSLDELPQIFNVLQGNMSLVGPRPTSFPLEEYELWQTERLDVKPGITGLWQVSGRSSVDLDERLRLDIEYISRRSIWFDCQILLLTVRAVIGTRGAFC